MIQQTVDEVLKSFQVRSEAMVSGDRELLYEVIDDEFHYTNSHGKSFTKAEYINQICLSDRFEWKGQSLLDASILLESDVAVLQGTLRDAFVYEGIAYEGEFKTLHVYRKSNGVWQWLAGQTTEVQQ